MVTIARSKKAILDWATSLKISASVAFNGSYTPDRFHSCAPLKGQSEKIRDFLFFPAVVETLNLLIKFIVSQYSYIFCQKQWPVAQN